MIINDYIEIFLVSSKNPVVGKIDENAANELASLVCGSFLSSLYEDLWLEYYEMEAITEHIEKLYDSSNYYGLIYFVLILAEMVALSIPRQFIEMSMRDDLVPILAAAVIQDWVDLTE